MLKALGLVKKTLFPQKTKPDCGYLKKKKLNIANSGDV